MHGIKIYLIIVTILLITALGFGVYVWYKLQTLQHSSAVSNGDLSPVSEERMAPSSISGSGAVVIDSSRMTDEQRRLLESFGFDPDAFVINESMIFCAEAKLGSARIEEITSGATPSFTEGLALLGCIE